MSRGPGRRRALAAAQPPNPGRGQRSPRLARGYFQANAARIDYPRFRALGLPIGSGAVESLAKHLVQRRMKRAGMRWSEPGEGPSAPPAHRAANLAGLLRRPPSLPALATPTRATAPTSQATPQLPAADPCAARSNSHGKLAHP